MAETKSASLQPPMPSLRSGEMFGVKNVPNGDFSRRPPPSRVLSSWLGVAWQLAQPPTRNMVLPLSRLGVCGASVLAATRCGAVMCQKAAAPMSATTTRSITSLRSIGGLSGLENVRLGLNDNAARSVHSLPRKRGKGQTEFAVRVQSTAHEML